MRVSPSVFSVLNSFKSPTLETNLIFVKLFTQDAAYLRVVVLKFGAQVLQLTIDLLHRACANRVCQFLQRLPLGSEGLEKRLCLGLFPDCPLAQWRPCETTNLDTHSKLTCSWKKRCSADWSWFNLTYTDIAVTVITHDLVFRLLIFDYCGACYGFGICYH